MNEDDTVINISTPTKSEFATFQVLANKDFVDLNKPLPEHTVVNVLEEEKEIFKPQQQQQQQLTLSPVKQTTVPHPSFASTKKEEDDYSYYSDELSEEEVIKSPLKKTPDLPKPKFELPKSKYEEKTKLEIDAEKEALLQELQQFESDGHFKPVRPLTMHDSLEEIQFQYDRIQSEINSNQIVEMAKSSIKMGSGMIEMALKNAGIKIVDGFHNNLCKDMNKFNRPLTRLYKKYWRRGGASPEMELGFIVFGSLAYTVVQNKMGGMNIFGSSSSSATSLPTPKTETVVKPPQMPSLNIPSSFVADTKWKEMELQQEKQRKEFEEREERLKKEMEEREKKLMSTIENMNNAFKTKESELYDQIQKTEKNNNNVRQVTLQVTATPKSKQKNKTELNLDD